MCLLSPSLELSKLYVEAKDNVKFLATLERHFKNISSGNLTVSVGACRVYLFFGYHVVCSASTHSSLVVYCRCPLVVRCCFRF